MKKKHKLSIGVVLVLFLFSSLAFVQTSDLYFQIKKQLTIFGEVYKEVATLYVDEVGPEKLMKSSINAMLNELDPYTVFIDEGEQQQMEILSSGSYGGIGVDAGFRGDNIVIIAPLEGYPAQRAGIRPGDIVKSINGVLVDGLSPEEVQELTIGDVGTTLNMTVKRPGIEEEIDFELTRERIEVKNIVYTGKVGDAHNIAYIQLNRFGQQSGEEIRQALLESMENGTINGLILDLRNNPGGLLNEAVEIVDKFIEPGVSVVETRGRLTSQNSVYVSEEPAIFEDLPIAVLMNRGSASASEVVAGAFQDLDRAIIIGEPSFGKGLVQTIRPLSYNTSLKLTISKYLTPSGRSIQSIDYEGDQGSIGSEIPDSLRRSFKTKNGRTVFDGRGIEPDILISDRPENRLETALIQENYFFNYVNSLITGGSEDLPENSFEEFLRYLKSEDFNYRTQADQYLEGLKAEAEKFENRDAISRQFQEIENEIQSEKERSFTESHDFIVQRLQREWISQNFGRQEQYRLILKDDPSVLRALEFLNDVEKYNAVLTP